MVFQVSLHKGLLWIGCAAVAAPAIAFTGITASHAPSVASHHGYLASGMGGTGDQDDLN